LSVKTIPVFFTAAEKENLEKQAQVCETDLPKLIRIRCLMDETDYPDDVADHNQTRATD